MCSSLASAATRPALSLTNSPYRHDRGIRAFVEGCALQDPLGLWRSVSELSIELDHEIVTFVVFERETGVLTVRRSWHERR